MNVMEAKLKNAISLKEAAEGALDDVDYTDQFYIKNTIRAAEKLIDRYSKMVPKASEPDEKVKAASSDELLAKALVEVFKNFGR